MNPGTILGSRPFGSSNPFKELGRFKLDFSKMGKMSNSQNGVGNSNTNNMAPEIVDTNLSFISLHINTLLQSSLLIIIVICLIVMCRCLNMVRLKKLLKCVSRPCTWSACGCCTSSETRETSSSLPIQYIGPSSQLQPQQPMEQRPQYKSTQDLTQPPLNPAYLPKPTGSLQEQLERIEQFLEIRERLKAGGRADSQQETTEDIRSKLGTWSGVMESNI